MLTEKIINKNSIVFADTSEQMWVEITQNESDCTMMLFAQSIPEDCRGKKDTDTVKCAVSCAAPTEAQRCQEALSNTDFKWIQRSVQLVYCYGSRGFD